MSEGRTEEHSTSGRRHSHHSHHSHSSHHSKSSHSHRSHHQTGSSGKSFGKKNKETQNIPAEYSKRKRIKLWWRSFFIALVCGGLILLVVLIFNSGNSENWGKSLTSNGSEIEELQDTIDELKTENMELKYELEKYKKFFGELEDA